MVLEGKRRLLKMNSVNFSRDSPSKILIEMCCEEFVVSRSDLMHGMMFLRLRRPYREIVQMHTEKLALQEQYEKSKKNVQKERKFAPFPYDRSVRRKGLTNGMDLVLRPVLPKIAMEYTDEMNVETIFGIRLSSSMKFRASSLCLDLWLKSGSDSHMSRPINCFLPLCSTTRCRLQFFYLKDRLMSGGSSQKQVFYTGTDECETAATTKNKVETDESSDSGNEQHLNGLTRNSAVSSPGTDNNSPSYKGTDRAEALRDFIHAVVYLHSPDFVDLKFLQETLDLLDPHYEIVLDNGVYRDSEIVGWRN
uniref:Uncharacterized protein n=1 Tax=Ditylenchus dipsaci TaxID=166011 RepID=A0A915EDM3_9BILA